MIEQSLILALVCQFIHACTWDGMIGSKIAQRLRALPSFITKPLFDCPICMVPYYGTVAFLVHPSIFTHSVVLTIVTAGGVNAVILKMSKK